MFRFRTSAVLKAKLSTTPTHLTMTTHTARGPCVPGFWVLLIIYFLFSPNEILRIRPYLFMYTARQWQGLARIVSHRRVTSNPEAGLFPCIIIYFPIKSVNANSANGGVVYVYFVG